MPATSAEIAMPEPSVYVTPLAGAELAGTGTMLLYGTGAGAAVTAEAAEVMPPISTATTDAAAKPDIAERPRGERVAMKPSMIR
jgi:hypothetical protein